MSVTIVITNEANLALEREKLKLLNEQGVFIFKGKLASQLILKEYGTDDNTKNV